MQPTAKTQTATAYFAGGCFWHVQKDFDEFKGGKGVIETMVGYMGGHVANPSYEDVCRGQTGHYEAIKVVYDPNILSFEELIHFFWNHIDPEDPSGQFEDKGHQYKTVIFYSNEQEQNIAEQNKEALVRSGKYTQVATQILPVAPFYPAEDYHQLYYQSHPVCRTF